MFSFFNQNQDSKPEPAAFIFIGRSGSGKGTQVQFLEDEIKKRHRKILHVETGALLREYVKGNSYAQRLVRDVIETGGLAPDPIVVGRWITYLENNFTGTESLLFDGAPRKIMEAIFLDSTLSFFGIKNYIVININVSRQECTERLVARMRNDDTTTAIEKRMNWYEEEVIPAIEFFRRSTYCKVLDINGEQAPEKVWADISPQIFGAPGTVQG